ncbi:apolipoprotein A-IV-like [Argopecten irradians]|uniref:apolipoprotein A-IV-like n=1 Tax=Argopecten irradians TaxID=31199 RepID=UPI003716AF9C
MSKGQGQVSTGIRCQSHSTVDAMFICLEVGCNEAPVCKRCITNTGDHFRHDIALLDDHVEALKTRIIDAKSDTRNNVLVPLRTEAKKVEEELKGFDPFTATLNKSIEDRGEKIINKTKQLVIDFKQKCNQIRKSTRQGLEQYRKGLLARITEVEADLTALERCLSDNCNADIVNVAKTGLSKQYEDVEYPANIQEVSFKASEKALNDLESLLGTLQIEKREGNRIRPLENKVQMSQAEARVPVRRSMPQEDTRPQVGLIG